MGEIEVRDYVRTKKGIARIVEDGRFVEIKENGNRMYYVDTNGTPCTWEFSCYIWSKDIVKHSKNIIDLIEVGDYVNGNEVVTVYGYDEDGNDRDDRGIIEVDDDYAYGVYLEDINIFSIVTKEQFASMEYKV